MATLALGGLGAAFAGSFGITALAGFQIGAAIGGYIDAANAVPDSVIGKLADLRIGSSSYGTRLPWAWGSVTLPGILTWTAVDANGNHLKETRSVKRVGGKGGGASQTTYTYSATFAIAILQASIFLPDPSLSVGGTFAHRNPVLKRVKADDIVIYDSSAVDNIITPAWHDGDESQAVDSTIASLESDSPAYRGIGYFVLTDLQLADFGNRVPNFTVEIETDAVTVGDILSDLFQSVGILPAEFDVSAATDAVTGFVMPSRGSVKDAINQLCLAYALDLVEVDGQIVAVPRGGSSVVTIPFGDLGASSGGSVQTLPRTRAMASELPGRVDVSFYDVDNLNQAGLQTEVRQTGDTTNIETYAFQLFMNGATGRNLAGRILDSKYTELERFSFQLPPKYLYLAPADIVTVPTDSGNVRLRVMKMGLAPLAEVKVEAVLDESSVLTQSLAGGTIATQSPSTYTAIPSQFVAWSGREVLDSHQESEGFYVAAAGPTGWSGCSVWYSTDGGSEWILGPDIGRSSAFGLATISDYGGAAETFGGSATLTVEIAAQEFLESTSASALDQGVNWAHIGGEYVAVQDYNLTGALAYNAATIKRGLRSTPMSGHGSNELFVEMTENVARVSVSEDLIGSAVLVKCVSRFQTIADVTAVSVTIAARTPLPVDELVEMSFVTLGASAATPNERVLTAGSGIAIVDSGAGGAVTIAKIGVATNREVDASYSYIATAPAGSSTGASVWRVFRRSIVTGAITWADGDHLYDNVGSGLAALAYS